MRVRPDGAFAVNRPAKRVHNPAEQRFADRHLHHLSRATDPIALAHRFGVSKQHRAYKFLLEIECERPAAA